MSDGQVLRARNSVYVAFIGAGFAFASWASRIPQVRAQLHVSPGVLGLILLCAAIGSAVAIPLAGLVIVRFGEAVTVTITSLIAAAGLAVVAVGYRHGIVPVAAGLFLFGFGTGSWDVAMNVQGATVERAIGRAIMPKFHAGWSIGTVAGAGLGTALVALHVPVTVHLLTVAAAVTLVVPAVSRSFLPAAPAGPAPAPGPAAGPAPARRRTLAAWTESRTLVIGLFVLCVTVIEGVGNDWLSLGVIDGYHTPAAIGTATLAGFLAAMTAGRWFGPRFIDRFGRVPALRACAAVALGGLLLVGFGGFLPVAIAGAVLMGLGTSLGFPVGMSAAADDPRYAAGRVSVTSSIGYGAFLAGPPVIGFIADHVGVLHALTVAGVLLVIALFASSATAPLRPVPDLDPDPVA
ncbi:MAG TPA: MFS transporter [Streptosporangiaceae bacterium]|jgi:MFS family permease